MNITIRQLYIDHHQWLQSYLIKQLRSQSDLAADLVQDTFVNLLQQPETISQIKQQRAFLVTIAKRKLFNFWRRQDLEQAYLQSIQVLDLSEQDAAEYLCLIEEALLKIDQLLNGLPLHVKHAFLLKKLEQMSHQEIAIAMNLSLATIERYIKQAMVHCMLRRTCV